MKRRRNGGIWIWIWFGLFDALCEEGEKSGVELGMGLEFEGAEEHEIGWIIFVIIDSLVPFKQWIYALGYGMGCVIGLGVFVASLYG